MPLLTRLTRAISLAGTALLLLGVVMTVVDILARQSVGWSVPGTVDLMQLIVMWAALAAIPHGFVAGDHVAVDLVTEQFPARLQGWLAAFAGALGCVFLWGVCWFSAEQAMLEFGYGDRTQTLGIPLIVYWVPMLAGTFLAGLAALATGLARLASGAAPPQAPTRP